MALWASGGAQTSCDNAAVTACGNAYAAALTTFANNSAIFPDSETAVCVILRDFFYCLFESCPSTLSVITDNAEAYQELFDSCGFSLPGGPDVTGTKACQLTGDPHVRTFSKVHLVS